MIVAIFIYVDKICETINSSNRLAWNTPVKQGEQIEVYHRLGVYQLIANESLITIPKALDQTKDAWYMDPIGNVLCFSP